MYFSRIKFSRLLIVFQRYIFCSSNNSWRSINFLFLHYFAFLATPRFHGVSRKCCFLLIAKKPKKNCILLTERCIKKDYNIIKAHTSKFIYINIVLWPITSNIIISVISIHFILDIIYSYYYVLFQRSY